MNLIEFKKFTLYTNYVNISELKMIGGDCSNIEYFDTILLTA